MVRFSLGRSNYLGLMASMRFKNGNPHELFTMEFLKNKYWAAVNAMSFWSTARVRFTTLYLEIMAVYLPQTNDVPTHRDQCMDAAFYTKLMSVRGKLFKDFLVNPDMLSTLKTNIRQSMVGKHILSRKWLPRTVCCSNNDKKVVESANCKSLLVKDAVEKTPSLKRRMLHVLSERNWSDLRGTGQL